jgi:anti-sigma regulatory factor (Ser/Thr protein kinase)
VIGDVTHRDTGAAALVHKLRAALRAYARLDLPPVEVLRLLDDLVASEPCSTTVTCGYAVFDPAENTLSYASAGQVPPLLLRPGGEAEPLVTERGGPLGSRGVAFAEEVWSLDEGALLALYTAGLVRGDSTDTLVSALGEQQGTLQERCDAALERLASGGAVDSGADAMLVVIGRRDPGGGRLPRSIELALSEGREPARRARAFCHGVLSTWQVPEHKREDIVLVVSELVTNAILHGGAAEQLRLRRTARRVVIEVFDRGRRMPHPRVADLKAESGRGLHLVARLADRWGARLVRGGKAVWCEFDTPVSDLGTPRRGGGEAQALSG